MKTGQDVYLRLQIGACDASVAEQRPLRRALVVGMSEDHWAVALEERSVDLQAGQHVAMFYTRERIFVQQAATIAAVDASAASCIVDLSMIGDPAPSEQREHLRSSALSSEATVQIGNDLACRIQDVSLGGFSIATVARYQVDDLLTVGLDFRGRLSTGQASVQNISTLWGHRLRYGLRCVGGGELAVALRELSAETQRIQLERLRNS